ncbi:MAG: hypothetical protein J6X78_04295 [Treponema sp.]|nr:hypothetical protein [Treponema sp.]
MNYLTDLLCGASKSFVLQLNGKRICILFYKAGNCSRIIQVPDAASIIPITNW